MVTREEIENKVFEVLCEDFECKKEDLKPETRLYEDLDLDSIDAVDLIVKLQEITKKRFNPEQFKQIRTLKDVIDCIEKIVNE